MANSVLIVGASVAGVGAANELRRIGYAGVITLVDEQLHLPYDRPPLSKAALSGATGSRFYFHDAGHYAKQGIELRLGVSVERLDSAARAIALASGEVLTADAVIIATGARARPFPITEGAGHIHVLRHLDHADGLRTALRAGSRLAVIGGGFIGAEVASSATGLSVEVVLIEAARLPFERLLGAQVAERLARLHAASGVELRCGAAVTKIEAMASGRRRLCLSDGTMLDADTVVAGLGSLPNVEWLDGCGIAVADGVICDERGRTSVPGIYAVGDVAAWMSGRAEKHERHEHWTAAREQGRIVAQELCGLCDTAWSDFIPYFWSDFHGKRIQMLGSTKGATSVEFVFDDIEKGAFLAEYSIHGALVGVVGCNAGARAMRYAPRLSRQATHSIVALQKAD